MANKTIKSKQKSKKVLTEKDLVGKRKAVTYQRFSSQAQLGNSSLERQTNSQKQWLKNNPDVVVIDSFVDEAMSGWSGKNLEKGSLGVLMQAIKDKIIPSGTLILVEHFSRLTRQNIDEAEELVKKIWKAGITIVTVRDNGVYPPKAANDMALRIRLLVEMKQNWEESKWRSEKVAASYKRREKDAKESNKTPAMRRSFWLKKDGTLNKNSVVIEDIFNWYMEGLGQQRIIVRLREKYPKVKPVQKMNPSTVMRWLQSEVVLGKWRGIKVYDAAIEEELFYDVQQVHKSRLYENVKPDRKWPLSGLMQCGVCGKGMSIQNSKGTLPVVRCSSKQRDRSCDRKTTFPYFIAHQYMFSEVQKRALRQYSEKSTNKEVRIQLSKIEHELTKLHNKFEEQEKLYDEAESAGESTRFLLKKMTQTDDKIHELEKEQQELEESIAQYDNYVISESARNLILTPRNFNLEMHKLNFRIVVGEDRLSTVGLSDPAPTMIYRGYSRKTLSYKYSMLGTEFEFPTKYIKESTLMLEGIANEKGELPENFGEILSQARGVPPRKRNASVADKKEAIAQMKKLLDEHNKITS